MGPLPQNELFSQTLGSHRQNATVQTLFFTDDFENVLSCFMCMVWIKGNWLHSVCNITKLLFSKAHRPLFFQGPHNCNFPSPDTGMQLWNWQRRLGSAATLAAHEDALRFSSNVPVQISDTRAEEPLPKACVTLGSYQIIVNIFLGLPWTVEAERRITKGMFWGFLRPRNQISLVSFCQIGWRSSLASLSWFVNCWASLSENGAIHGELSISSGL